MSGFTSITMHCQHRMAVNISRGLHYTEQCAQNHLQVTYLCQENTRGNVFDLIVAEGFGCRGVQDGHRNVSKDAC